MTTMKRPDWLDQAMHPDQPDEFAFQIDCGPNITGPDTTFSLEAMEALSEQVKNWVMARLLAHRERKGFMPKHMRLTANLDWNPRHPDVDAGLYYHVSDDNGPTALDGSHREATGKGAK